MIVDVHHTAHPRLNLTDLIKLLFKNKKAAQIAFGLVLTLSLLSILLALFLEVEMIFLSVLALSMLFNAWSLFQNGRSGFVKSRHMWRAEDPPRRFDMFQVVLVCLIIVAQAGVATFKLM